MSTATRPVPLDLLMRRYGTDKFYAHHYEAEYARHFDPIRDRPINLLEIGIGGYGVHGRGGESLKVWRDYFADGVIHGLDVEDKSFLDGDRLHTHKGSQSDAECLIRLVDKVGNLDIVIDDGSHIQSDILTSFNTLFPLLNPGGIYVIEDLETAYRQDHGGNPDPLTYESLTEDPPSAMALIAYLVDGLHWRFWQGRTPSPIQASVHSVHVSHELVFIYKAVR